MSIALAAGVTGLESYQKMLDIAGDNLANVGTTAFKASRITFAQLLSETIKTASQPTNTVGGTNPQQLGHGVGVASITPTMTQGNIINTGNSLDLAIEGDGYFVLNDGSKDLYTRAGAFAIDANSRLVDPATGYIVQRIGTTGEADGFQTPGNSNVCVPNDVSMPANATTQVKVSGNLSTDATFATTQTNVIKSAVTYTTNNGTTASTTTELSDLDQWTSGTLGTCTITASGYDPSGNALSDASGLTVTATTTLGDLINHLNNNVLTSTEQVASLSNGKIVITDASSGYSKSDLKLTFANTGGTVDLTMPAYFEVTTVGGEEVKNVNITVYDTQGGKHVLSGAFVRTDTANTWDLVLTSISGDISGITFDNRRIEGIEFYAESGAYKGLNTTTGDSAQFVVTFAHDIANPQTISIAMGTVGQFDGLTQFAGNSTAVAREQDGYAAGTFSSLSVSNEGIVVGAFTNGIKKDIAAVQLALFQNPSALEAVGNGYYIPSANSGEAIATQALSGGAGSLLGGSLESSNVNEAKEFVNLIQAQNYYQANARTIRVANEMLRELTNLIR
jgi:flagellar hook protein FlgE